MTIGVPKEIKTGENRIALTPAGARVLTREGHVVLVETGAGGGSGLDDAQYEASGAKVVACAEEVWRRADMVLKVKEPVPSEVPFFREGLLLFMYPLSVWGFFYDARFFGEVGIGLVWKSKNREKKSANQPLYLLRFSF